MREKYILAGDIGGTKTILALFTQAKGAYTPVVGKKIQSQNILDFSAVAKLFLQENSVKPEACCFGVAGPVFAGKVRITKLGWQLSEDELKESLDVGCVTLVNDLAATAYAIPVLKKKDFHILNEGQADRCGNKTIIAPGTGLGEVFLTYGDDGYNVHASEGGHCLFAPVTQLHRELLEFLSKNNEQITYDLICSGRGIPLIYSFLKQQKNEFEPSWLAEKFIKCDDRTPFIMDSALGKGDKAQISIKTVEIFVEILASEAANCALKLLSSGGVYLAGGIPPRILDFLKTKRFIDLFTDRKPFHDFLVNIPFAVVTNPKSALIGAACYGMNKLGWINGKDRTH